MKKNIQIGLIVVIVIIILGIIGIGYTSFNSTDKMKLGVVTTQPESQQEGTIVQSEKEGVDFKFERSGATLQPNIKPQFKVGQKFGYVTTSLLIGTSVRSEDFYFVKNIERINGTDYYVIFINKTQHMIDPNKHEINMTIQGVSYIDVNSGEILKIVMENSLTIEGDKASKFGIEMYAPWTLALKEGIKWIEKFNMTEDKKTYTIGESEYEVIGMEKMNNRKCFKVQITSKKSQGTEQTISAQKTFWIDANERILVKAQTKIGNLGSGEMNLVTES